MSEITRIVEELNKIHQGDAWHGLSLHEALAGLTAEQAAARLLANAHTIWELVSHIAAWENVWGADSEARLSANRKKGTSRRQPRRLRQAG